MADMPMNLSIPSQEQVPDRNAAARGLFCVVDESGEDYLYPENPAGSGAVGPQPAGIANPQTPQARKVEAPLS
jgi:hypothetical protein